MAFGLAMLMRLLRAVKLSLNSTSPKAHSEGDPYQSHFLGAIDRVGLISAACCLILIQTISLDRMIALEGLILYIAPLLWALSYFSSEHSRARLCRCYHTAYYSTTSIKFFLHHNQDFCQIVLFLASSMDRTKSGVNYQ
jgi:hypothetical protein